MEPSMFWKRAHMNSQTGGAILEIPDRSPQCGYGVSYSPCSKQNFLFSSTFLVTEIIFLLLSERGNAALPTGFNIKFTRSKYWSPHCDNQPGRGECCSTFKAYRTLLGEQWTTSRCKRPPASKIIEGSPSRAQECLLWRYIGAPGWQGTQINTSYPYFWAVCVKCFG